MLKHQEKAGKPKAQKSQEAHQHPLEKVKLGDVGFRFKKYFGHHHNGWTLRSERETSRVVVHLYFLSLCLCLVSFCTIVRANCVLLLSKQ